MRTLTAVTVVALSLMLLPSNLETLRANMITKSDTTEVVTLPPVSANFPDPPPEVVYKGDLRDFLEAVGRLESGGRYNIVSRLGYLGKYQFHPETIRVLGFNITRTQFLNDPRLQDRVMIRYMRANERELRTLIDEWAGKTHKGVEITHSGIIAGAHFAGSNRLKRWFNSDHQVNDVNGWTVERYMTRFGHYNIDG